MRTFALPLWKNGEDPQNRQWVLVSAPLDETPTRKIYEVSGKSS
jgi:hypothetical protein